MIAQNRNWKYRLNGKITSRDIPDFSAAQLHHQTLVKGYCRRRSLVKTMTAAGREIPIAVIIGNRSPSIEHQGLLQNLLLVTLDTLQCKPQQAEVHRRLDSCKWFIEKLLLLPRSRRSGESPRMKRNHTEVRRFACLGRPRGIEACT